MPFAKVNGINIHYKLEGDGPEIVVLVNGLADDLETWEGQMDDLLNEGFRVLRYDNRGIGKSDRPAGHYTTRQMADDGKALVDHLGISDFHLLGVSMGGMIAQEWALAYPDDLRSALFCATYAWPGPFCTRMFEFWRDAAPKIGPAEIMRDVTVWAFTQDFFENRTDELEGFEKEVALLDQTPEHYLAQLNSIIEHDTRDRLKNITVPTLVLAGEEDILIPVELSRRLHQGIAGSVWATCKGGHACLWEHPKSFNDEAIKFMNAHRRS